MSRALRSGRARLAVARAAAPIRAAIYCRVSSDERLGQSFNSLHAQREAGENYVNAHRTEGWVVLTEDYSDGGFTGANTNRPGLKRLLADIEAGKVDRIIVYKLDRLSRSMRDFLNLLDFFERHDVGFVSVSQSFDTSTPIGKMTLNLLASFGEFERQVIAERTRDKIRAARRRGRWTGGMPPLGYDVASGGGKLLVNQNEAEVVKAIFQLYFETESLAKVAAELNRRGWHRKSWTTRDGKPRQGGQWDRASLRRLLIDPVHAGMITLGTEVFRGEHPAIVPKALFDKVQNLLNDNRASGGASQRNQHGALLRGLLRCAACDRSMSHTPTKAHGRLYRYYTCQRAMKEGAAACPTKPVAAQKIEDFVVNQIRRIGAVAQFQCVSRGFEESYAWLPKRNSLRNSGERGRQRI